MVKDMNEVGTLFDLSIYGTLSIEVYDRNLVEQSVEKQNWLTIMLEHTTKNFLNF